MEELCIITTKDDNSIRCHSLKNGALVYSFKQNNHSESANEPYPLLQQPLCVTCMPDGINEDKLFFSLQRDRPLLHIYTYGKEVPSMRFSLIEKMVSITATRGLGTFLVAMGSISGKIYLYSMPGGELIRVIEAHYKPITRILFSQDNTYMITSSEDATVHVWNLAELYHPRDSDIPKPLYVWSDHSLPVTDIKIGIGQFGNNRVITSSLDNTVKYWDLSTGELLVTYLLPSAVYSITMDQKETTILAGCADALIYQLPLYKKTSYSLKAISNDENLVTVGLGKNQGSDVFKGNKGPVLYLKMDITGTQIVSGDILGNITIFDVNSKQPIRTLVTPNTHLGKDGSVTSLHLINMPSSLKDGGIDLKSKMVNLNKIFQPFQKTLSKDKTSIKFISFRKPPPCREPDEDIYDEMSSRALFDFNLNRDPVYKSRFSEKLSKYGSLQSKEEVRSKEIRIQSLMKDVQNLYEHYQKQKAINSSLYEFILNNEDNDDSKLDSK